MFAVYLKFGIQGWFGVMWSRVCLGFCRECYVGLENGWFRVIWGYLWLFRVGLSSISSLLRVGLRHM